VGDGDHDDVISIATTERTMSSQNYEAEIAAFIRTKGVTRCPTACVAPTHASGGASDRAALRRRTEQLEATRQDKARQSWKTAVASAA
jgi:hypothetical protein